MVPTCLHTSPFQKRPWNGLLTVKPLPKAAFVVSLTLAAQPQREDIDACTNLTLQEVIILAASVRITINASYGSIVATLSLTTVCPKADDAVRIFFALSAHTQATITSQLRSSDVLRWSFRGFRFAPPTVNRNLTASRLTKLHRSPDLRPKAQHRGLLDSIISFFLRTGPLTALTLTRVYITIPQQHNPKTVSRCS